MLQLCTTPACLSTFFYRSTIIPSLVKILPIIVSLVNLCISHHGAAHPSYISNRMKVKYPLCIFVSYVQSVHSKNCLKSTSLTKLITVKNTNGA